MERVLVMHCSAAFGHISYVFDVLFTRCPQPLALERVTEDQLAVREKSSLSLLLALPHELPEHELRVGQGKSPLLDQCRRQDPSNSLWQVIATTEMRMEQNGESREPGIHQ